MDMTCGNFMISHNSYLKKVVQYGNCFYFREIQVGETILYPDMGRMAQQNTGGKECAVNVIC